MANSLTAFNPEYWSKEMQRIFFKENIALPLANTELREYLRDGDTLHKPYRSYLAAQNYTKGTDISTFNDLTATDEYLTVDTTKVVPFYVDDLDKIQNKWDMATKHAQDAGRVLNNILDQAVLGQYSNADSNISAQDLGGSGTGSIEITQANIANMFSVAARKLDSNDIGGDRRAVIGPRLAETLKLYVGNRETGFGDIVGANGYVGSRFGFQIHQSNNLPFTSTLTYGATTNNPSNGDTVTIDGVTFNFVSTISTAAGNILIETNATNTIDNLVACINNTGRTENTNWVTVSSADRRRLLKHAITATNSGSQILTVTGYGDVAITEDASNLAVTTNVQYPVFMIKGAIDLVTQKSPSVEFRVAEKRLGRYVYPWMLYGIKTFKDMTEAITYAQVDTSDWV